MLNKTQFFQKIKERGLEEAITVFVEPLNKMAAESKLSELFGAPIIASGYSIEVVDQWLKVAEWLCEYLVNEAEDKSKLEYVERTLEFYKGNREKIMSDHGI